MVRRYPIQTHTSVVVRKNNYKDACQVSHVSEDDSKLFVLKHECLT